MEETMGKRIAGYRKRMGLTQEQLADQLGVTAQAVSKWEHDLSCPDISTLPRLAEIFGCTTDALLGTGSGSEAVRTGEVVSEPEQRNDRWQFEYNAGWQWNVGVGICALLVGGLLLAARLLNLQFGFWEILWPSGLLIFGILGLLREFSVLRAGCVLLGGWFLLENMGIAPVELRGNMILPVCLLLLGGGLLVDAFCKGKKPGSRFRKHAPENVSDQKCHTASMIQENERFTCENAFSEDTYRIDLERLSGGKAESSFGELTVDLSGCREIAPDCQVDLACSFGQLNLLVPRRFRILPEKDCSFSYVKVVGEPDVAPQGVIRVACDVSFGGVEIRYVE